MSSIEKAIERLAKTKSNKGNANESAKTADVTNRDRTIEKAKPVLEQTASVMPAAGGQQSAEPTIPVSREPVARSSAKKIHLDYESLSRVGYIVPHSGNKQLSEEYRIIKRPVIMNALGKGAAPIEHGNLISISSSLPSEGKTFTAMNLALSISTELDSTVLLIDGDVLRCSLSTLLGIEKEKGLIDLLEDKSCTVGDVILETQIPRLKVISAGKRSEKSTELLASKEMEEFLNEVAVRYQDRIIIFDSPPMLSTSESIVLNQHMGQVLVVVEAGGTPVEAIKDTLSRLDSDKAIGLVLNKSREVKGDNYYGTYY
ncbi:MAG: XrtA-associated tyrosine autokinase [Candidatus Thiodiazotropha sp. (ex Lucina aurantia)]|uniref:non-specific protein-tyrosine kinase n=1 Tax=Candidatus Thiodiazotropha taylori TaxID=2792791 RepID=A0A9E4NTW9_9GAMM|nr:XrtA-associated tyrosine autokinase [Candidatus Thiodiazotropha sp. (ex Lucina pensylvanica)]MBT3015093.1 XrtA-associated tyrosine autokinase [Candidatus Thiodiazotropha taylori]MBT3038294.1 XrtA-associated tyrosine autokinase [Candidatus Thiodiazotropha sp. (ex Codakia orbicularis)]MBV2103010.1 XrtA-associated tyrosine autokinase [Candidatus Thiodiazotropha sp. (ex Lucina aurantia)]MCG7861478.1 XrtA-associated tyrosine autokinase [Candidatus Thiodiazotropha endolucinida]